MEITKEMCDAGGEADEYPSYMVIYEALHDICKEQRSIIDKGVDLAVLCSTFGALPRSLNSIRIKICVLSLREFVANRGY